MKHKYLWAMLLLPIQIFAQHYSVDKIPANLLENADAVIRTDETVFTLESINKATEQHYWAITVLNENGEDMHAMFKANYDKLSKIKKIEGVLYDAQGYSVRKLKNSEIQDYGLNAFGDGVGDSRVKIAKFDKRSHTYPYTIEFSYVEETKNMMFYPTWIPNAYERTSVQKSSLKMLIAKGLSFRKKELNLPISSKILQEGDFMSHTWQVENLTAYKSKSFLPPNSLIKVITAPTEFEIEGYHGYMQTWNDLGKFYANLNQNRNVLPQEIKDKVKELTQNETDITRKVQKIYAYLQESTRYMSIQLGIGGWQTIEAKEVVQKGYGDCKALSNYMNALLTEAGIKAHQALISAGSSPQTVFSDFANMQFNHVITCVPMPQDTLWLECTSQTNPFGYLGSFTGNRKALLVYPDGGRIVNTKNYLPKENGQARTAKVLVDAEGNAKATVITKYSGIQQETREAVLKQLSQTEQKEWLLKRIAIPSFELDKFEITEQKQKNPVIEEKLDLFIKKAITKSGTRYFLTPNLMTTFFEIPIEEEARKEELYLDPNVYNFEDTDQTTYQLPENLTPEYLPQPVKVSSKFGEYSQTITLQNNVLSYNRHVMCKGGTFAASDYNEWVDFIKKIKKQDRTKVVFVEKK